LAEGLDDGLDLRDADFYKQQAKLLFKNLSKGQHEASRMSIETGSYFFQYPVLLVIYFMFRKDAYLRILLHHGHFMLDPSYFI
jgi:hypothetical protein